MRGIAEVTAVTLVAEIGQFSRFSNPRQLMSYAGLAPKEYSSGSTRWQGSITKTGNSQVRRSIVKSVGLIGTVHLLKVNYLNVKKIRIQRQNGLLGRHNTVFI
ncbi:MAG: transposase [Bacillota bacterium]